MPAFMAQTILVGSSERLGPQPMRFLASVAATWQCPFRAQEAFGFWCSRRTARGARTRLFDNEWLLGIKRAPSPIALQSVFVWSQSSICARHAAWHSLDADPPPSRKSNPVVARVPRVMRAKAKPVVVADSSRQVHLAPCPRDARRAEPAGG